MRYEYATPQWEDGNHLANFDLAAQKPIYGHGRAASTNRALVHPDRNNWAPRVGLAYSLTPKTVIRSGYGISYIHFNRAGGENLLAYNPPSVITIIINNPDPSTAPTCAADVALHQLLPADGAGLHAEHDRRRRASIFSNVSLRYTPADYAHGLRAELALHRPAGTGEGPGARCRLCGQSRRRS